MRSQIGGRRTVLWKNAPDEIKSLVKSQVSLSENEEPVIIFFRTTSYVLLLTTQGLVVLKDLAITKCPYSSIADVTLKDIISGKISKKNNITIDLLLKSGGELNIMVEEKTWHVLYNIIKSSVVAARSV